MESEGARNDVLVSFLLPGRTPDVHGIAVSVETFRRGDLPDGGCELLETLSGKHLDSGCLAEVRHIES